MNKLRSIKNILLVLLSAGSTLIATQNNLVIELLNNSNDTIVVNKQQLEPHKTITVSYNSDLSQAPIFTIKDTTSNLVTRTYRVLCKKQDDDLSCDELPSSIKMDFQTIRFIALSETKHSGYDEICIYNDMPYDIFLNFIHKQANSSNGTSSTKSGIMVEPGRSFHKTVHCTSGRCGQKNLRALGRLIFSIMTAKNDTYTALYPRRVYTHASLVGLAGWKCGKISAQTLKLFNDCFSAECV